MQRRKGLGSGCQVELLACFSIVTLWLDEWPYGRLDIITGKWKKGREGGGGEERSVYREDGNGTDGVRVVYF